VELAQWVADYYAAGVGDAIPLLLPPMARGGRVDAHKTRRMASITPAGLEAVASAAGRQREALELLAGSPAGIAPAELAARGIAAGVVARLAKHGQISVRLEKIDRDPFALVAGSASNSDRSTRPVRVRSEVGPSAVRGGAEVEAEVDPRERPLTDE